METVDTENILDRLREIVADTDPNPYTYQYLIETCDRAADDIERLRAENTQLRQWYSEAIGSVAPERLESIPPSSAEGKP